MKLACSVFLSAFSGEICTFYLPTLQDKCHCSLHIPPKHQRQLFKPLALYNKNRRAELNGVYSIFVDLHARDFTTNTKKTIIFDLVDP